MGNFGSKENILNEIEGLFKKMNSGKLTLDELEDLVSLSRELHERTVILRYKAFEEKVFGERPAVKDIESFSTPAAPAPVIEIPSMELTVEEEELEIIEEPILDESEEISEDETEESDDAPSFEIDVKVKDEPVFGFSLFDSAEEEENEPVSETNNSTVEVEITSDIEDELEEEILPVDEEEKEAIQAELPEAEPQAETSNETALQGEKPMSDIERAHAENLARFFSKKQEQEQQEAAAAIENEKQANILSSFTSKEDDFEEVEERSYGSTESIFDHEEEVENELEEENVTSFHEEEMHEEEFILENETHHEEPVASYDSPFQSESATQVVEAPVNNLASSTFVHKFNQVQSELSASQFGLVKLDSLLGSFGLNERLQFINELFDGSSEAFSIAIKNLDQQPSSEHARSKVAECAVENNWDVESETVAEFMQKIIRRYA